VLSPNKKHEREMDSGQAQRGLLAGIRIKPADCHWVQGGFQACRPHLPGCSRPHIPTCAERGATDPPNDPADVGHLSFHLL